MAKGNVPFLSFNRGLIGKKALARVDVDRTALSAEVFNNWLPKTQGAMIIRPGTKYKGNPHNDTGAMWVEFVAATNDVALVEFTNDTGTGDGIARFWLGTDAHNLTLLERPPVDTTLTLEDTGWSDTSEGGVLSAGQQNLIPDMASYSSFWTDVSVSSDRAAAGYQGWKAADRDNSTKWEDTGEGNTALPSWFSFDLDALGFDTGRYEALDTYTIRASDQAADQDNAPTAWRLLSSNDDTGTYATDTGKWKREDLVSGQTGWAVSEKRTFNLPGYDTGTVEAARHWRLYFTAVDGDTELAIAEIEFRNAGAAGSGSLVNEQAGAVTLNAQTEGSLARYQKRVVVSDTGTEHGLYAKVSRGPVKLRVGSTSGDDDYISETALSTGCHNLAFTPAGNFHVTLQTRENVDRTIDTLRIADSGTVEVESPYTAAYLDNIRYDQSADVVYVAVGGLKQRKIERRGTGRSWSIVEYQPNDGPFFPTRSTDAKLRVNANYGNATMRSDAPFFKSSMVDTLVTIFHNGQSGNWALGNLDATTDAIEVTGVSDTGLATATDERTVTVTVTGTWSGTLTIERSFDGPDIGFKPVTTNFLDPTRSSNFDTGINDDDDNIKVWYRVRMTSYSSGTAKVYLGYEGGGVDGIARITSYNSNTNVDCEILSRFSDTGSSDDWREGYWSTKAGFPSAVSLHGGRLYWAEGGSVFASVADDYESYNQENETDAAPIIRTLGSGPVDSISYIISLLRLIIGTAGAELALRSSSLDEPLTPTNASARAFSTQGSASLRAVKLDTSAVFVQRSNQRVFLVGFGLEGDALGDYKNNELTFLVPDLMAAGVVSIAVQRQPDTRIHCVLGDGTVAILTYEPQEEVLAWSTWSTDTGSNSVVERAMVLPGESEDAIYYQIKRTINGTDKRFLEKWALESECQGDTGLHFLADCASSYTDTGRTATLTDIATHLAGETVIGWGSLDTGSTPHIDLSPDSAGVQQLLTVDTGGDVTLSGYTDGVHHAVVGLPYEADWKSTKLAYAAKAGTALTQMKRTDKLGFILYNTHNNALFFGNDTGTGLDPLPRVNDEDAVVDPDLIFAEYDKHAIPFPGLWDEDSRVYIRAKAPRPATVLALVPTVQTHDKI
jgi:hypothetical protein